MADRAGIPGGSARAQAAMAAEGPRIAATPRAARERVRRSARAPAFRAVCCAAASLIVLSLSGPPATAQVFDPVAAVYYNAATGGSGWRRESYGVRSVPVSDEETMRFISSGYLLRGH